MNIKRRLDALQQIVDRNSPCKMIFVYADGHQESVTGFLQAVRLATRGDGIVKVLGANDGLSDFILSAQCDLSTLWDNEDEEVVKHGH